MLEIRGCFRAAPFFCFLAKFKQTLRDVIDVTGYWEL